MTWFNRIAAVSLLVSIALSGCGQEQGRVVVGQAPQGATDIFAVDTKGRTSHAAEATGEFRVELEPGAPVVLFFLMDDGTVAPLVFDDGYGDHISKIPDFTGTVDIGNVWVGDAGAQKHEEGDAESAESDENPLDDVDSDGDGESDLEDSDDDDDGVEDEEDADDDGNGIDDSEEDLDDDDDGSPDASDDDDDGDDDDEDDDSDGDDDDNDDDTDEGDDDDSDEGDGDDEGDDDEDDDEA